ncbi:porin [Polycladidibacter hongkongensis]|uniref:porin n=1 Tax=Polycladidibacter hongkongensis TaxID=1647556 RepID=UPI00155E2DEC|nr:porin [Pseudovibrio hongkongensis]
MPVVAEPVDYVQACDAFGAGFFKLPGKDTCIKVGGRIRATATTGNLSNSGEGKNYKYKSRGSLFLSSMTETEFGLIKTFVEVRGEHNQAAKSWVGFQDTYVQIGFGNGQFTAGYTDSKFNGFVGFSEIGVVGQNWYDKDVLQASYTQSFGSGLSASLSLEDSNKAGGADNKVDLVAALEANQGWGFAKVAGVAHQNKNSKTGYAVIGELEFDLAEVAPGFKVGLGAAYAKDAVEYVGVNSKELAKFTAGVDETQYHQMARAAFEDMPQIYNKEAIDALRLLNVRVMGPGKPIKTRHIAIGAATEAEKKAAELLHIDNNHVSMNSNRVIKGFVRALGPSGVYNTDRLRDYLTILRLADELVAVSNKAAANINSAKAYQLSGGVKFALTDDVSFALDGSYLKLTHSGTNTQKYYGANPIPYGYDFDQKKYGVNGSLSYAPVDGLVLALDAGWERTDSTVKGRIDVLKMAYKTNTKTDNIKVGARVQYTF